MAGLFGEVAAAQQGAPDEKTPGAPIGRNRLEHRRFIAPDECVTRFTQPAKKVDVFAPAAKLRSEGRFEPAPRAICEQHVTGSRLWPRDSITSLMTRTIEKSSSGDPIRRFLLKSRQNRTQHGVCLILPARLKQLDQPVITGNLVVINKCHEVA